MGCTVVAFCLGARAARTALVGVLMLSGGFALAAEICVGWPDPATTYSGAKVDIVASRGAIAYGQWTQDFVEPTVMMGGWVGPAKANFVWGFTPPVENVTIRSWGSNCDQLTSQCDRYSVDVNGARHAFTAADINPLPDAIYATHVVLAGPAGDIQGNPVYLTGGTGGVVSVSTTPVSILSLTLESTTTSSTIFNVCFSAPQLQLALKKEASAARWVAGQPASYTLTLTSVGGMPTTAETTITDEVPPSLTIGQLPAGCSRVDQLVSCKVPAGLTASKAFVIPVTPQATAAPRVTNIATASGGGDPACDGTGACASAVTTDVTLPLIITSTKTASANPLLIGAQDQFYTVAVKVANQPTTAPLAIEDMLPTGITLAGPPILFPGTTWGTLSGCAAAGSLVTGCRVATGVAPGTFEIRIPVNVDTAAAGAQTGTNTVNLSGGGDSACTALLLNEPCDATTPPTDVRQPDPKVRIVKEVIGGSGANRFHFALSGLNVFSDTITVTGKGSEAGAPNITGTIGVAATISETSPAGWPRNPVSASCVDSKDIIAPAPAPAPFVTAPAPLRAGRASAAAAPILLVGNTLTIPSDRMVPGADFLCTFVNSAAFMVTGRVFNDNGSGAGTANDGLVNGGEKGLAGVQVRFTNCAAGVLATAVSDGLGRYSLEAPSDTWIGDAVCVEEVTPAGYLSTGASVAGTQLPSGVAVSQGGKAYTYTRTADGTPDRIAFMWNDDLVGELNFGDVAFNRFGADSARSGSPGSSVSHAHTFVAQTGGAVSFGVASAVAAPPIDGWSAKIHADPGCTGALQGGAAVLYPPSVPTTVVAGQNVCVVLQEFIPAGALAGATDKRTVEASFNFTNAAPGLSASYLVNDTTTVSSTALELRKEVRNVTKDGPFGLNNDARSGETLEYRITYTNNGATPINGLMVNDVTPVYTSFAGSQEGTTPATLTACTKRTPANAVPAPPVACTTVQPVGGAGPVDWKFAGQLAPGGKGTVLFKVTVN